MHALTLHAPEDLRHERVSDPTIEEAGDALVRVALCGICGSDLHPYFGRETGWDPGTVQGHEFVGEVVAVGGAVARFAPGDRVHCPFTTSCGDCASCRSGLTSRCERGQLFGWRERGEGLHGGQAELVRVPMADSTLVAIPEGVGEIEALLLGDVLATGWFCAEQGGVAPGKRVAVVGSGPVGLMAIVACRELGAERIVVFDPVVERRAWAERFGAEAADPEALDPEAAGRFDVVLEAVGSPSSARLGFDLVRPGGVLSMVGVHTHGSFPFSPEQAYDKNLTLRVGRCPARALMERLVPVVLSGRCPLTEIVTDRLALEDGPEAYRRFAERRSGCLKVVLEP